MCACKCQIDQIALSWQINWNIVGQTTIQSMDCLESPRIIKVDLWLCMTCPFFDMAKDIYTKTKWYQMIYFNYPYFFCASKYVFSKCFLQVQIYMSKKHSNQLLPQWPPLLCSKGSPALGDIETREDGLHHAVLTPGHHGGAPEAETKTRCFHGDLCMIWHDYNGKIPSGNLT